MKFIKTVLLALSFVGPAVITSTAAQAQAYDCFESEALEATCGLMNNARQARSLVLSLASQDPNTDLTNAARYSLFIVNQADQLARLLSSSASDQAIETHLERLHTTVLQLDATKRKLQSRYPGNYTLVRSLTSVRTMYYYLEGLLLPVED
ncbi:hypothetical protein [Oligoflexus tunisiensis]|uniref:hypothetical protein n=1 Tax=Oligoflexus tunisiensis TaxID=708132 RepID=UPI00114D253E|nr:hypothetical protein [Oligoflexus tunisiensis]